MEILLESQTAFVGYSTSVFLVGYDPYIFLVADTPIKINRFFLSLQVFLHLFSRQ